MIKPLPKFAPTHSDNRPLRGLDVTKWRFRRVEVRPTLSKLWHSSRLRASLLGGIAVLIAIMVAGLATVRDRDRDLAEVKNVKLATQAEALGLALSYSYQTTRGWDESSPILQNWAFTKDLSVVLLDPFGEPIDQYSAFSTKPLATRSAYVLDTPGFVVGQVIVGRPGPSVWSWLAIWFLVVPIGLVAGAIVGATVFVATGFPRREMHDLAQVAGKISRGNYSERAAITSGSETQELATTINAIASKLEAVDEERSAIMAEVFHELRRPLTNVQGFTGIMQDEVLAFADRLKTSVSTIYRQVHLLSRQMEGMNFFTALDSGQIELMRQREDVSELLTSVTAGYETIALSKNVSLSVKTDRSLPPVYVDRDRLAQVMGNLLDNAMRHMPKGGDILVSASRKDGQVVVSVRDSGEGIDPEILPHIFDRFYSRREPGSTGFGIGLTIAKNIVALHGGEIWATSKLGQGATFSFTLPPYDPADETEPTTEDT